MKRAFLQAILWLSVLSFGIRTGAATYEALVITPLWAGNPPASVRGWNPVAEFAIQPVRYWVPGGIALAICTLGLLLAAVFRSLARRWCLLAGLSGLAVLLSTALFFVPILVKTIFDNGATLSDAEIVSKVHAWVGWNWLRYAVLLLGWLATVQGVVSQRATLRLLAEGGQGDAAGTVMTTARRLGIRYFRATRCTFLAVMPRIAFNSPLMSFGFR